MGYLEQCTDDQIESVCEAYKISREAIQRDIQTLMDWLEKQPHLPNVKDEKLLRMFFLRCRGSLERTKNTLESYYIHKARMPTIFAHRDPSTTLFKTCFHVMIRLPLPKLANDLTRVAIIYMDPTDDKVAQQLRDDEVLSSALTTLQIISLMSGIHTGFTIIIDLKNFTPAKVSLMMSILRKFILFADMQISIKMIYVLNLSSLMESVLLVGRQLSKKLFQERLTIWKKGEKDLAEMIPKENLPYEYGGTLGRRDELKDLCLEEMASWKDWLYEESKYVADLSKLPEDKKQIADISNFGMEGSFRKMNLE